MPTSKLPPEGCDLLVHPLDTSEKLELTHALWIAGRPMSTSELEIACRLPPSEVREVLGSLTQLAVVEALDNGTRFRVSATARAPAFEALMTIYEDDRSVVLAALTKLTLRRIRDMAVEAFADPLELRRRNKRDA